MDPTDEAEAPDNRSEDAELVYVDPLHSKRALLIRTNLNVDEKARFENFLCNNLDVFA